jgi:hypothetical protein
MRASERFKIQGHVNRGFEGVREAFIENFVRRRELGGGCCAFQGGQKVVDLWRGIRNKQTGERERLFLRRSEGDFIVQLEMLELSKRTVRTRPIQNAEDSIEPIVAVQATTLIAHLHEPGPNMIR